MNNLLKIFLFLISLNAFSQITPFYTTRILGTGGAGVASILVNEASLLNPASIVFIPITNIYYQKSTLELEQKSLLRNNKSDDGLYEIFQLSDTSSDLKGTLSYQKQARNGFKRKKIVSSLASKISAATAMGLIYSYNEQTTLLEPEQDFHQISIGLTHVFSSNLSIGFVLTDPFKSNKVDSSFKGGLQYALFSNLIFIQDLEYHLYNQVDEITYRTAIQINFFDDFFLRGGMFSDKLNKAEGHAYGLSWVGPKLAIDFSIMKSKFVEDTLLNLKNEEDLEASFALSVRY